MCRLIVACVYYNFRHLFLLSFSRSTCDSQKFNDDFQLKILAITKFAHIQCNKRKQTIGTLHRTLSIVWCVFHIHDVSGIGCPPVFRWLVVMLTLSWQRSGSNPGTSECYARTLTTRQLEQLIAETPFTSVHLRQRTMSKQSVLLSQTFAESISAVTHEGVTVHCIPFNYTTS